MAIKGGNSNLTGADRTIKPELRTGKRTCQCTDPACELYFSSPAAFDRHLVRDEKRPNRPPDCMGPEQMRAIGMTVNEYGVWSLGISQKKLAEKNSGRAA